MKKASSLALTSLLLISNVSHAQEQKVDTSVENLKTPKKQVKNEKTYCSDER